VSSHLRTKCLRVVFSPCVPKSSQKDLGRNLPPTEIGERLFHKFGDRFDGIEALTGSRFGDSLWGDHGANRLDGGHGDDTLTGNGGDDYILAGLGTDVIVFSGNRADYTITRAGFRTVVDHGGGTSADGTDTLAHAEVLRFADGDMIL